MKPGATKTNPATTEETRRGPSGPERPGPTRRRLLRLSLLLWIPLLTSCENGEERREIEASGTVEATEADLGFQLAGRIDSLAFREGDSVPEGARAGTLEQEEIRAQLRSARASLEAARARLAELESGFRPQEIAQARAALRGARERAEDARRDLERARRLFEGGAVSREALDKARTAAEVAESSLEQAREQLRLLEEGPREEQIRAQRAVVAQAEAAVARTEAMMTNAAITIPFPGIITLRHREPGETVSPGLPVYSLMDPDDRWVRIYVREDRIGAVSLGQGARISSDTYPDRTYDGEVVFIASEAEFTPRNVQTTEERVKLVYAVKVRITGDPGHELKPGIPADVVLLGPDAS
jgi:HlyD family secretion protein